MMDYITACLVTHYILDFWIIDQNNPSFRTPFQRMELIFKTVIILHYFYDLICTFPCFTWFIQIHFPGPPFLTPKVFSILARKTNNCDKKFIATLGKRIENLKEVGSVDEGNIILIFCPIVSRTGADIEAALNKCNHSTGYLIITQNLLFLTQGYKYFRWIHLQ